MPQAPESQLSKRLSKEYPQVSRKINSCIRNNVPVKLILEDGDAKYLASSSVKFNKDKCKTIDLRNK